jgi:hypothetical protein
MLSIEYPAVSAVTLNVTTRTEDVKLLLRAKAMAV